MSEKSYRVFFYKTAVGNNGWTLKDALPQLSGSLSSKGHLLSQEIDGYRFQIRDLAFDKSKNGWKGVFGRLRSDAPNVINMDDIENPLPLSPTDLLIEKCHFIYKQNSDLLIWQFNFDVGSINRFAIYLSNFLNLTVGLNMIVDTPNLKKILNGDVKYYEIKVALPNQPIQPVPSYSPAMFDLMNDVGGSSIKYRISAGREVLSSKVKRVIQDLFKDPNTESLKVGLEGIDDPVDLFTDRVSSKITVELRGHYPDPFDIYNELDRAFYDNKDQLNKFIE